MNKLEKIGAEIIASFSSHMAFKKNMHTNNFNPAVIIETPKIVAELTKWYGNPELFVQVLMNVHKHWAPELNQNIVNKMLRYHEVMQEYAEEERKAQQELIKFANSLPENQRAEANELSDLADQLSDLMGSGANSLHRKMNSLGVKKTAFKKPSSRKKDITSQLTKSFKKL